MCLLYAYSYVITCCLQGLQECCFKKPAWLLLVDTDTVSENANRWLGVPKRKGCDKGDAAFPHACARIKPPRSVARSRGRSGGHRGPRSPNSFMLRPWLGTSTEEPPGSQLAELARLLWHAPPVPDEHAERGS